jgi:amino acid transporter
MRDRFGLIFLVLVVCGTLCILGALVVLGMLFNSHALAMSVANPHEFPVYVFTFMLFVLTPALIAIFTGIWLARTGIRIGQKTSAEPPEKNQQ